MRVHVLHYRNQPSNLLSTTITMTTPVEQMFLYSEVDPEYPSPSAILALLGYADWTAGGAIVLALIVLTGLIIDHWADLKPWISAAVIRLAVSPLRVLASSARSLVMQLAAVRSAGELQATLWANFHPILEPVVVRLRGCLAPLKWCCPSNRPPASAARLSGSFIVSATVYFGFLLPASKFLYGLSAGLISANLEQSRDCLDILQRLDLIGQPTRSQWLEMFYCSGEEAGLEVWAVIEDDWQLSRLVNCLVDSEIYHLYAIAFAVICVSLVIVAASSSDALSWAASFWQSVPGQLVSNAATKAQLRGTPLTDNKSQLWDKVNKYESDLRSLTEALNAKVEELSVVNQTQDEGWLYAKRLSAQQREAEVSRRHEADENAELRTQLGRISAQLSRAQGKQVQAAARARTLSDKVVMLEHQLAHREDRVDHCLNETHSPRAELDAQNEQITAVERQLAAAKASEDQSRSLHQQLSVEHQQLTVRHNELAADNHRLTTAHRELQAQYDDVFFMSEPVAEISALEQERDCVKMQLASLQDEYAAMKWAAENYYQKTQGP